MMYTLFFLFNYLLLLFRWLEFVLVKLGGPSPNFLKIENKYVRLSVGKLLKKIVEVCFVLDKEK